MKPHLYGYYRSGTTYRVRIALSWKQIEYSYSPVNLKTGEQQGAHYLDLNPQGLVPCLAINDQVITQSPAILEWIEETYTNRPLLPAEPSQRAKIRAFAAAIGCDIHPIQNLRVMKKIRSEFNQPAEVGEQWARHWIATGFTALETLASQTAKPSGFLFSDGPSLAEVYLVAQMYNAKRFNVDLTPFPRLCEADEIARKLPEFDQAKPENQIDASNI